MPRLSVDIDVLYLPLETTRDEALNDIQKELSAIASRIKSVGLQTRLIGSRDIGDTKLIVNTHAISLTFGDYMPLEV
jgi:hypothetical protein